MWISFSVIVRSVHLSPGSPVPQPHLHYIHMGARPRHTSWVLQYPHRVHLHQYDLHIASASVPLHQEWSQWWVLHTVHGTEKGGRLIQSLYSPFTHTHTKLHSNATLQHTHTHTHTHTHIHSLKHTYTNEHAINQTPLHCTQPSHHSHKHLNHTHPPFHPTCTQSPGCISQGQCFM